MTCPFNESYTLPVDNTPIYENAPTGRVEECNACLLHPDCAGDGKYGCYQPCFGYELIDEVTSLPLKPEGSKYNVFDIDNTINKKWEDKWEYIMFLKDPTKGTITNVDGKSRITASDSTAKLTDPLPPGSTSDDFSTKLTFNLVFTPTSASADLESIDVSLYRYRASLPADSGFEKLQDVYAPVFSKLKEIMDENKTANHLMQDYDDINFYNIRKNDPDTIAKTLFESVKGIYNLNTSHVKTAYKEKKSKQKELEALQSLVNDKKIVVDDLKALNHTSKRQIEINMYKSKKMEDTNKALMIVMIVVGCLVIFPILAKTKIASIGVFVGLWIAALLIVLIYMFYVLYYKKIGQDELEYAKYNFNKPSDKEVALSIANATLNKKDKQRCQAFAELEEDLEIPNIEIDINDYNNATEPASKCGI